MRNAVTTVLSAVDDVSRNGIQIDAGQIIAASFQSIFGDTDVAGTIKIQMSNDIPPSTYQANTFTVTNWSDIPSATAAVTAGVCPIISIPQACYRWMRVVFTQSAPGATTIHVNMNQLGI